MITACLSSVPSILNRGKREQVSDNPVKVQKCSLLVIVISGITNNQRRRTIRDTWFRYADDQMCLYFVIGIQGLSTDEKQQLVKETQLSSDLLLLEDFNESYFKLTEKMLKTFKLVEKTVEFDYILKVDDDSFVRLDVLQQVLKEKPKERFYYGFFDGRARVKKQGQWAEKDWFLCDRYLPHARGGGYILSSDLVKYISTNSNLLQLYKSEDISVGAWLSPLKITREHDVRFDTEWRSRGCHNSYIVTHKQSASMMKEKFANIKNTRKLCGHQQKKLHLSFIYNWSVLPSNCCQRFNQSIP